jgi:anti-sigma factor RsiW
MTKKLKDRDWRDLSAYLDGQLSSRTQARLENELAASEEMRAALEDLRQVRVVLRSQPRLRAPRNFTLSPQLAGISERRMPAWQLSPVFGFVSALASVLLILVFAGEYLLGAAPASAPMPAELQAKSAEVEMVAAPTLISPVEAPALSAAQEQAPAVNDQRSMATQATQVAPVAGAMEYPAPMALESGSGAYPPPAEPATNVQAFQATQMPAPTPAPTQEALAVAESESASPEEPALRSVEPQDVGTQVPPPFWSNWRIAQGGLLLLAIISGVIALILRRGRAS